MNYREKIRKAIECPQFNGTPNYGKWGALNFEQRLSIKRLLDELDNADECVKKLYEENKKLKQWDNNKDGRNSRQRIANKKLHKENEQLKARLELFENGVYFSRENDRLEEENDKLKKQLEEANKKLYLCTPEIPQNVHGEFVSYVDLVNEIYELKEQLKVPETYNLKTLEDYKSYYEDTKREQILEDTYIDYCAYVNLAHECVKIKEQLEKYENPEDMTLMMMWATEKVKDENKELKKQQQEFIKYLEHSIKTLENDQAFRFNHSTDFKLSVLKNNLQRYKDIIGNNINVGSKGGNKDE